MPPVSKKQAVVFIYDFNTKNPQKFRNLFEDILAIGRFSNHAKDLCRLVRLNYYSSEIGYDGETFENMDVPFLDDIRLDPFIAEEYILNDEESNETDDEVNWVKSIKLALQVMQRIIDGHPREIVRRHIVLLTDFSATKLSENTNISDDLNEVIQEFQANSCFLYILGPDVQSVGTLSYPNSERFNCMNSEGIEDKTIKTNVNLAKKLLAKIPGVMANLNISLDIYFFSQSFYPKQIQNDYLKVGGVAIPCKVFSNFIKKRSHVSFKGGKNTSPIECVLKHDIEQKVHYSNVTEGLKLHGKFLQINKDATDSFKVKPPKTFQVLSFVPKEQIKEYLLGKESTSKVTCSEEGSNVFAALLDVLLQTQKLAIVQRNYRNGLENKLYVLIPQEDRSFVMSDLAFADDVKKHIVETDNVDRLTDSKDLVPSQEEEEEIFQFLKQHDVIEREDLILDLDVNVRLQPSNKVFYQKLKNKYLGRDLDENVSSMQELLKIFVNEDNLGSVNIPDVTSTATI